MVVIAGMGRFGQTVNRLVAGLGHRTVVIDNHPQTVERMRRLGIRAYYGDVGRPEMLEAAGVSAAKAVVLATGDPDQTVRIARWLRRQHPDVPVIARARDRHEVYRLQAAGVSDSVREVFDSAVRASKYALSVLGRDAAAVEVAAELFVKRDRRMLKELAELWREDVPEGKNAAFDAKAHQQRVEIEASLRGESERHRAGAPKPRFRSTAISSRARLPRSNRSGRQATGPSRRG